MLCQTYELETLNFAQAKRAIISTNIIEQQGKGMVSIYNSTAANSLKRTLFLNLPCNRNVDWTSEYI